MYRTLEEWVVAVAVDVAPDLDQLREQAGDVEALVTPPHSLDERTRGSGPLPSAERRAAWFRRVEDSVLDLSNSMPEGVEDYDVRKLLGFVVDLRRALESDPDATDRDGEVEIATMRVADVVKRVGRRLLHERLDDPQAAAAFVLETLGGVNVSEVAALLGVSTKTVGSWRQGSRVRNNTRRVIVIAQVLSYLRASMTAIGIVMWFDAERDQLGGLTPLALLEQNEASAHAKLIGLARATRGQLAD
jgi:DNA-directed RNA polymerase specialized sigma24 family protein